MYRAENITKEYFKTGGYGSWSSHSTAQIIYIPKYERSVKNFRDQHIGENKPAAEFDEGWSVVRPTAQTFQINLRWYEASLDIIFEHVLSKI